MINNELKIRDFWDVNYKLGEKLTMKHLKYQCSLHTKENILVVRHMSISWKINWPKQPLYAIVDFVIDFTLLEWKTFRSFWRNLTAHKIASDSQGISLRHPSSLIAFFHGLFGSHVQCIYNTEGLWTKQAHFCT